MTTKRKYRLKGGGGRKRSCIDILLNDIQAQKHRWLNLIDIGLINIGFFLVFVKYNILEVRNATFFSEDGLEKLKSGEIPQRDRSINRSAS